MGIAAIVDRALRTLEGGSVPPLAARSLPAAEATRHALAAGDDWAWRARAEDTVLGVVVADAPLVLRVDDGAARILPGGAFCLLHPERAVRLRALGGGSLLGLWLPRATLSGLEPAAGALDPHLPSGPLADGLRLSLDARLTVPAVPADSAVRADPADPADPAVAHAAALLTGTGVALVAEGVARAAERAGDRAGAAAALDAVRRRAARPATEAGDPGDGPG